MTNMFSIPNIDHALARIFTLFVSPRPRANLNAYKKARFCLQQKVHLQHRYNCAGNEDMSAPNITLEKDYRILGRFHRESKTFWFKVE